MITFSSNDRSRNDRLTVWSLNDEREYWNTIECNNPIFVSKNFLWSGILNIQFSPDSQFIAFVQEVMTNNDLIQTVLPNFKLDRDTPVAFIEFTSEIANLARNSDTLICLR